MWALEEEDHHEDDQLVRKQQLESLGRNLKKLIQKKGNPGLKENMKMQYFQKCHDFYPYNSQGEKFTKYFSSPSNTDFFHVRNIPDPKVNLAFIFLVTAASITNLFINNIIPFPCKFPFSHPQMSLIVHGNTIIISPYACFFYLTSPVTSIKTINASQSWNLLQY